MRKLNRGFTLFELITLIVWLGSAALSIWLISLVARALMKYIGI